MACFGERLLAWIRGTPARSVLADRILIAQSGLFDAPVYLRNIGETDFADRDPILHFLLEGWRTGADPGPDFATQYYLQVNEDVQKSGQNPLVHYLRHGKAEGRQPLPPERSAGGGLPMRIPTPPSQADWEQLFAAQRHPRGVPLVDVLVPVYGGYEVTMVCLHAVVTSHNMTPYQLVIIDDCSPQFELQVALNRLAENGNVELHRMSTNVGFAAACNFGMKLHPGRDVILLNSDTEVYNDWIDRLRSAAYRRERTGTVTPLSNNAEICSYPQFVCNNERELEIPDAVLDMLAACVNADHEVEIPTGVGFCMYLRRDCLDDIGFFDVESFGQGYGEDNDLCRRAVAAGWRNILAPNVFVRHFGGTSFGRSKAEKMRAALQTVERRHPKYISLVDAFIQRDPVRPFRESLDMARMRRRARQRAILFITHRLGGGTERHVTDLSGLLEDQDTPVFYCRPDPEDSAAIKLQHPGMGATPNLLKFDTYCDIAYFADYLKDIGIVHIHVHHLAGFADNIPDFICQVSAVGGIRYDVTIHDYMVICPRINLVNGNGIYCGEPDLRLCEECIDRNGSPFGRPSVRTWRDRYARLLKGARIVFVPDEDVAERLRDYFSDITLVVRPHPELRKPARSIISRSVTTSQKGTNRRVIVLGAIGPEKGSTLLQNTAVAAAELGLPLEFLVIGFTDRDSVLNQIGNVTITGEYSAGEESGILASAEGDLAWFPVVCPETYSYTLSAIFDAGLFPVAFDFGAIASRIRRARWGVLLPPAQMQNPALLARLLLQIQIPQTISGGLRQNVKAYPAPLQSYYGFDADFVDRHE